MRPPNLQAMLACGLIAAAYFLAAGLYWHEQTKPSFTICPLCGR